MGGAHLSKAAVAGTGDTPVLLVDDAHAGVRVGIAGQNVPRPIRCPVVHADELEVRHRLRKDAVERLGQDGLAVEDGHDHADLWSGGNLEELGLLARRHLVVARVHHVVLGRPAADLGLHEVLGRTQALLLGHLHERAHLALEQLEAVLGVDAARVEVD